MNRYSRYINNLLYSQLRVLLVILIIAGCSTRKKETTYNKIQTPPPVNVVKKDTFLVKADTVSESRSDTVKLLLILPFSLKENFSLDTTDTFYGIFPASLSAVNFYEGVMLAADSLRSLGLTLEYKAIESPADSGKIARIARSAEWLNADMVFADLMPNLFSPFLYYARLVNKNIVLLQAPDPEVLNGNSNVVLAYASTFTQCRTMGNFLGSNFENARVIIVYRNQNREDFLARLFMDEIKSVNKFADIQEFNGSKSEFDDIITKLSSVKQNLVIVVSSDEAFVSPVISTLNNQEFYDDLIVAGLPTWQQFESIDFMANEKIDFLIFENNFINKELPKNRNITSAFINQYSVYPNTSGYNGFNLTFELVKGYSKSGSRKDNSFVIRTFIDNRENYFYKAADQGSGYENIAVSILQLSDYKLKKINKTP